MSLLQARLESLVYETGLIVGSGVGSGVGLSVGSGVSSGVGVAGCSVGLGVVDGRTASPAELGRGLGAVVPLGDPRAEPIPPIAMRATAATAATRRPLMRLEGLAATTVSVDMAGGSGAAGAALGAETLDHAAVGEVSPAAGSLTAAGAEAAFAASISRSESKSNWQLRQKRNCPRRAVPHCGQN